MQKLKWFVPVALAAVIVPVAKGEDKVAVHGSVQANTLFPETDAEINAKKYDEKLLGNGYADLGIYSKYIDGGFRLEYLKHPLPGFDVDPAFKGWGLSNIYVKGKYKGLEFTGGDFYEQFGSGFILRTYEDRPLGIDNSIRGARLKANALKGVRVTALGGVQRRFWDWSDKRKLYGADAELQFDDWFSRLQDANVVWSASASYVLKQEDPALDPVDVPGTALRLNVPRDVSAMDFRTHFSRGGLDILGEYAWKGSDPSAGNGYIYKPGNAALLSATYSQRGWSALLQAKRSENMAYRSRRATQDIYSYINNMPPFSYQHTYSLAAMYPYGTQAATGEWAFQGQGVYSFKRKTALGGKYGTKVKLNVSYIAGLKTVGEIPLLNGYTYGTDGPKTSFFGIGDRYYEDINVQIEKKVTQNLHLNLMYMYLAYNKTVVEGEGGNIYSNIFVVEPRYRINEKFTLRSEVQYLHTRQDRKDWLYGLMELSMLPNLMFSVSDMWNCGSTGTHYYMATVTGNYKGNRLMLGYGRTRQGFDCSGGICREVPAQRGFQVVYNYSF